MVLVEICYVVVCEKVVIDYELVGEFVGGRGKDFVGGIGEDVWCLVLLYYFVVIDDVFDGSCCDGCVWL